ENTIEAVKSLPKEIKEKIIFFIIGDGEDYAHLKKISSEEQSIAMFGNLPRERAIAILKVSDIYIHSAHPGGGLSTSLLEAMYCGCAIIATPHEGADEIIIDKENGFLIERSDKREIAGKIQEILNDGDIKTIKEKAKSFVSENFSWNNSIEKYVSIFNKKN